MPAVQRGIDYRKLRRGHVAPILATREIPRVTTPRSTYAPLLSYYIAVITAVWLPGKRPWKSLFQHPHRDDTGRTSVSVAIWLLPNDFIPATAGQLRLRGTRPREARDSVTLGTNYRADRGDRLEGMRKVETLVLETAVDTGHKRSAKSGYDDHRASTSAFQINYHTRLSRAIRVSHALRESIENAAFSWPGRLLENFSGLSERDEFLGRKCRGTYYLKRRAPFVCEKQRSRLGNCRFKGTPLSCGEFRRTCRSKRVDTFVEKWS